MTPLMQHDESKESVISNPETLKTDEKDSEKDYSRESERMIRKSDGSLMWHTFNYACRDSKESVTQKFQSKLMRKVTRRIRVREKLIKRILACMRRVWLRKSDGCCCLLPA